ncbi:NADH-quinone oxidoreductase subunit N [Ktedonosporobacter rubrisoli]|uniref:NADH-quinone oxidoreductase subunit N n=1 Tax=Ktedonosporobacter rubrisoli TaxID=2509675 RepID=A0A4P6JUN8_KTERU|nr:NADH-quinone oxidoreductase subunit N [Ktedonosporobacter rubrisoli]QBD79204.1 NADH-quinone oxidoreductase subunit N [Ktedonosporobacter rubrisoli]
MFHLSDLYLLAPELTLTLLALVVMVVDLFVKRRAVVATVALVGLIVPVGFTISQALTLQGTHTAFFNMLTVDPYALFFDIIFLMIAAVMILASYDYVGKYVKADGEFYVLMLFSVVGMMLMASTTELITIYISLELTSIPLYVMAGLIRTSERSAEASVKYVLLGAMSSAILLYGFALIYGLTGTTDLQGVAHAIKTGITQGNLLLLIASVLIIAGFGFKISAVPFHMWAPDIYEGAPTPATAFFSVGSKAAGFAALIRVFMFGGLGQVNLTSQVVVLSIVAVLTMTLGNIVAAVQSNVKRMMAYSSIAQAGYILVGFIASFATNKPDGNAAVLFFILVYVITNLGAFAGIITLAQLTGGERIEDFRGLWRRAPLLSVGTALCLLSLAGIPPVAGFWSKIILFTASWGLGQTWLVVIALLNSIVSLVYYGRLVKVMFFDAPVKNERLVTPLGLGTAITLATAALLVITVVAQLVLQAAMPAAASLMVFLGK